MTARRVRPAVGRYTAQSAATVRVMLATPTTTPSARVRRRLPDLVFAGLVFAAGCTAIGAMFALSIWWAAR